MADSTNLTPEQLLEEIRHNPLCHTALRIIEEEYGRLKGSANRRDLLLARATEKINQGSRAVAGVWELADGNVMLALEQSMSELMAITEAKRNLSVIGMLMYERTMELTSGDGCPVATQPAGKGKKVKTKQPILTQSTYRYKWCNTHLTRIVNLYQFLSRSGLIARDTNHEDFEALFMGKESTGRIKWLAPQAWLWYMLREMERKAYITMEEGQSIWVVASSHFVDKDGRLFTNVSFSKCKEPKKAVKVLDQLVEILNAAMDAPQIDIMDDDPEAELWANIKDRGWEMNERDD